MFSAPIVLLMSCGVWAAGLAPSDLRCEYAVNPLGIDAARPRLSWMLRADRRGESQTAYQVVAATSLDTLAENRGDLWDSGKVVSDRNVHVEYGGKPPGSGARVYWMVRVWDRDGQPSAYSAPAWWETGLFKAEDWSARWISANPTMLLEPDLRMGAWIWYPDCPESKRVAFIRRGIELNPSDRIESAVVKLNADNVFELYVNGGYVGENAFWDMPRTYDITADLVAGRNVIAVKAVNLVDPAGFRAAVRVRLADGRVSDYLSDATWRVSIDERDGWQDVNFDDADWASAADLAPDTAKRWLKISETFGPPPSLCLRRAFRLDRPVARARAYASALGLYELHINGHRVGEDVLTPGWTDYPKRVQYQTYDVTPLLREGNNAVGAMLGNGWFAGDLGWSQKPPFSQGPLRFLLQLDIEYADGTRDRIITDESWRGRHSPISRCSFFNGEVYDARAERPGWCQPSFDDAAWVQAVPADAAGRMVAQQCEPMRVVQKLEPVGITEPSPGVRVVDFGQNAAGRARLAVRGERGTRVRLRFAEQLRPDGNINQDNLRSAKATDVYILAGGGRESWAPRFTYHGFRYCEVTGYPGELPKDALTFEVIHSDVEAAGQFECSNPLLNRIWRNILWSQRSNMYSVWTDCPQRDERLGWTGDGVAIAPTACWNMQMARFFAKWTRDIADGQAEDGGVPDIAPNIFGSGAGAPGWSDAITILPWTVYQFYGDERIIRETYPAMARWVEFMREKSEGDLYTRKGYGDWVAPVKSPIEPISAAYYYRSTDLLAKMARAIGKAEEAAGYSALAKNIAEAFNRAYFDEGTSEYAGGTQAAYVLPLYFGLVPGERVGGVVGHLVADIQSRGDHLSTGFQGTAYLMPTLSRYGRHETAYRLATQTTPPSWGHMVRQGATTMWELWDADEKGPEMNSRNHAALGAVGRWFFETLAGIRIDPDRPGFAHIIIAPVPVGDLVSAGATYRSVRGPVASRWRRQDERFTLSIAIPVGSVATVHVPADEPGQVRESGRPADSVEGVRPLRREHGVAVFEVQSGAYEFTSDLSQLPASR